MQKALLSVIILFEIALISYTVYLSFKPAPQVTIIHGSDEFRVEEQEKIADKRDDLLLPDMLSQKPTQMYITNDGKTKTIRFNTTFANMGAGPMELVGDRNEEAQTYRAFQKVTRVDGSTEDFDMGEFIFHPGHDHWHIDRYAQFKLYSLNVDGSPKGLLASTDKLSFCIWDEHAHNLDLQNAPQERTYQYCTRNTQSRQIQGNSVGWGDTYTPTTEGQELDITHVRDGTYMVESTINADFRILESSYDNNFATQYIKIQGDNLEIIEDPSSPS